MPARPCQTGSAERAGRIYEKEKSWDPPGRSLCRIRQGPGMEGRLPGSRHRGPHGCGDRQGQLAEAVGTTQSVISRIERADQNLTLATLSKIAGALRRDLVIHLR